MLLKKKGQQQLQQQRPHVAVHLALEGWEVVSELST